MATNFPNGLLSRGVPVESGMPLTKGDVYHVDSGHVNANDTNSGSNPTLPMATIDAAVGRCTATNGDVILVSEGHVETISAAAGIALDVAGITVIGLGHGTAKPTLTFSATASDINVSAANVVLRNFRLVSNVNSLVNFLDLDAGNFLLEGCEFVTGSATEALCFINLATTFDDFEFRHCKFFQPTDPAGTDGGVDTGVFFIIDSENILVEDCEFYGNFETAIFHNRTTACKNLWVKNCHGVNILSGSETFQLVDGANGAQLGGGFITPNEAAVTEATLVGTVGAGFFVLSPGKYGNDGAAGGSGGIIIATPS